MDNFEWAAGYEKRFGLHWVDFDDPDRPRLPKKSTECFKEIMARSFPADGLPSCLPEGMTSTTAATNSTVETTTVDGMTTTSKHS